MYGSGSAVYIKDTHTIRVKMKVPEKMPCGFFEEVHFTVQEALLNLQYAKQPKKIIQQRI